MYYGQTERSLKTRVSEHKKAVVMFNLSAMFTNVIIAWILKHEAYYHQRLFLEAWMSVKDPTAVNDPMVLLSTMSSPDYNYSIFEHYLFLVDHSFLRSTPSQKYCSLFGTDNVRGQTSEHIFAPNRGYCLHLSQNTKSSEPKDRNISLTTFYC